MGDGHVDGANLICGVHGRDDRLDTGISEYNNIETLPESKSESQPFYRVHICVGQQHS